MVTRTNTPNAGVLCTRPVAIYVIPVLATPLDDSCPCQTSMKLYLDSLYLLHGLCTKEGPCSLRFRLPSSMALCPLCAVSLRAASCAASFVVASSVLLLFSPLYVTAVASACAGAPACSAPSGRLAHNGRVRFAVCPHNPSFCGLKPSYPIWPLGRIPTPSAFTGAKKFSPVRAICEGYSLI